MKATQETGWRGDAGNPGQVHPKLAESDSKTGEFPEEEGSPVSNGELARSMGQDWIVRGVILAIAVASIPFLVPILSHEWLALYGHRILEPIFLLVLILSIFYRLRSVEDVSERWFWNLLIFGFVSWLLATATGPFGDRFFSEYGTLRGFVKNVPYVIFYVAIAAALEIHPHVRDDPITHRLKILDWTGLFILLFGFLSYFLVIPRISSGDSPAFWASSLALFVALDVYIVVRLWHLRGSTRNREWQSIYTWLLIGAVIWGFGDFMLSLMFEGIIIDPGWGTLFDLLWPISFCAVVVATRSHAARGEFEPAIAVARYPLGMGPLVAYALVPLLLHVSLYRFGVPDPEFRLMREVLVLGVTAILATMTLVYHRFLRIENNRLNLEEAMAKDKLAHQAFHDELTGLPNRNLFRDRLQLAIENSLRNGNKCAVLFCDLDQFKVINDSQGHEAGDQALVATAQRLRASIRRHDTVARFGGDEFAIIVESINRALDAAFLAEKILAAISEPLVVERKNHVLTASIGIAVFPDDGKSEEELLKHADTAMYQAKLHGRNSYRLFTQAMNEAAEERLAVEKGLRSGIIDDQFEVFYQPTVDLMTNKPVAFEALLRWNHPVRGYITPVNFIDVAEQTGLIVPIGKWVLDKACTWAAQLDPIGGIVPSISVNMSARQFRDPDLVQTVSQVLVKTGLEPSRLQIEITESMALDQTVASLDGLRKLGVQIAIDNFGTGYAALSLLQDLAVDIVKIDGSFVKGIEVGSVSEAIVLAIVNMARALDFYVVAEGVETEAELKVIRQSQCDAAQGFYLCKPLPPEKLKEWIASANRGIE